jgi:hypothetical protein
METILVKIFATALALSQVTTTPDAGKTQFDRYAFDDALASFAMAYAVRTQKDYDQLAKSKRKAA